MIIRSVRAVLSRLAAAAAALLGLSWPAAGRVRVMVVPVPPRVPFGYCPAGLPGLPGDWTPMTGGEP
jgi:hypothetical protein